MLTFVRLAVLSFVLAYTGASSFADPREHVFAYNPTNGIIGRIVHDMNGQTDEVSVLNSGTRENVKFNTTDWILDVEIPEEESRKPVVTLNYEKAYLSAKFPDGKYLLTLDPAGYRIADPSSFIPLRKRPRIENHQGKLENGEIVQVYGQLKDGRLWLAPLGNLKGYFREREGVIIFPTAAEIQEDTLDYIRESVASDFDGFNVSDLDLTDTAEFQLFRLYILTRFMESEEGFGRINKRTDDLLRFLSANSVIPRKLDLETVDLQMNSRRLRLRLMKPLESVFRGCLGQDCSTNTRFFRALEPAHLNFAIEEVPFKGLGQIEVILGKSADGEKKLAFLERVQSPKRLREYELRELILSVHAELRKAGYAMVMPEDLKVYTQVAHPISNNPGLQERLETMFAASFVKGHKHSGFNRNRDVLPNEDPRMLNMVAHHLREKGKPVYEMEPTPEAMQNHIDYASIVNPYRHLEDPRALLAWIRAKIVGLRSTQHSRDLSLTEESWKKIEAKIFTVPCEYKVTL